MEKKCRKSVEEVLDGVVEYKSLRIQAAKRVTGWSLKLGVWLFESRFFGGLLYSHFLKTNNIHQLIDEKDIPDAPMFFPEYPPSIEEVVAVQKLTDGNDAISRVRTTEDCISADTSLTRREESTYSFKYWTIRDFARAYRNDSTTPSKVAEHFISAVNDSEHKGIPMRYFISFDPDSIRKQAAASTERFYTGNPFSVLDGIFMAVKDDIDCAPHPSTGGTVWINKVRQVNQDAFVVAQLRKCGVIFTGKTNMHELGMGTTGSNSLHGTTRNPHDPHRYTGGSSSGSASIVASGLCPAALGTDVGGSLRIPSSLCGLLGLKSTNGRLCCAGSLEFGWTMHTLGPITANVEDLMLVYAAMVGDFKNDLPLQKPPIPCVPFLGSEYTSLIGQLKFGKYPNWFADVSIPEVSEACNKSLELLCQQFGTKILDITLPELEEMRAGHLFTVGSELMTCLNTKYEYGRKYTGYGTRGTLALFKHVSAKYYIASQCFRRRLMYYFMEAFKQVDVIVTPTTPMTAPLIPLDSLAYGESDLETNGDLMRFIVAGNFLGLPCLSVPVGYDAKGLPIGMQLIGRPWHEATLMHIAAAIEELQAPSRRRPEVFYDLLAST